MNTASKASHEGSTERTPPKAPSLKERIENNLVVFFLATLLTGFLAGLGSYQGALKIVEYTTVSNESLRTLREERDTKTDDVRSLESKLAAADAKAKAAEAAVGQQRWLRIRGVEGLDDTRARLVARVNGRAFSYPSRAVWSRLGPGMAVEEFPLPVDARSYEISFELLTLSPTDQFRQFQSQEVVAVKSWPFEYEYKIFAVTVEQSGSVRGSVAPIGTVRGLPPVKERRAVARIAFEVR